MSPAIRRELGRRHAKSVKGRSNIGVDSPPKPHATASANKLWPLFCLTLLVGAIGYAYRVYSRWDDRNAVPVSTLQSDRLLVPFQVLDLPGRGKGAVATREIQQGELILREKPLLKVPRQTPASPGLLLLHLLAELTPTQRGSFYNLSYVNLDSNATPGTSDYNEKLALAILQTNAVSAGDEVGLFPHMARLNHGCSSAFNTVYSWREREQSIAVHALKKINAGEELLTTYTDTKRPRAVRRQFLHKHYGFECSCAVCSLSPELSSASDLRLVTMSDLYSHFATWQNNALSGRDAIETARRIWRVGEEEGYWSERGQLAADATWVAASHADATATREWAHVAWKWYGYELGRDSDHAREMQDISNHPEQHVAWGTRRKENVGGPQDLLT